MSAISSVGSSSGSLYLQSLQKQQQANGSNAFGGASAGFAGFQSRFEAAAKSIGVDPAKLPDIEKQIQDAVSKAKENGGSDPRSSIRDAIDGVLKDNGIDPTQFQSALKAQAPQQGARTGGAHRHHGGHHKPETEATQNTDAALSFAPKDVQPGQTTGTLVDVAA